MRATAFIFGAGGGGQRAYRFYGERFEVLGFLDNNPHMAGKTVQGLQVWPPDHLARRPFDRILIASGRGYEIYDQLLTLGIDDGRIEFVPGDVMGGRYEPPWRLLRQVAAISLGLFVVLGLCIWV